jgi:hypothetical protein
MHSFAILNTKGARKHSASLKRAMFINTNMRRRNHSLGPPADYVSKLLINFKLPLTRFTLLEHAKNYYCSKPRRS